MVKAIQGSKKPKHPQGKPRLFKTFGCEGFGAAQRFVRWIIPIGI